MLCDDLGWDGDVEGRIRKEGICVYIIADSFCGTAETNATL